MSTITNTGVSTSQLIVDSVIIGGSQVTGVTSSPNTTDAQKLVTGQALYVAVTQLQQEIAATAGTDSDRFTDTLVSRTFDSVDTDPVTGWEILGWTVGITGARLDGDITTPANYLRVPAARLPEEGRYFAMVTIPELTGGELTVRLNGIDLAVFDQPGSFAVSFVSEAPQFDVVDIVARNLLPTKTIRIATAYLVGVPPVLADYVIHQIDAKIAQLEILDQTALDAAFSAHTGAVDPHTQYLLRNEGKTHLKGNRVYSPLRSAIVPAEDWISAPVILRASKLLHSVDGPFDIASGNITSTIPSMNDLYLSVRNGLPVSSRQALFSDASLTTIRYMFIESRLVSGVTLYINKTLSRNINAVSVSVGSFSTIVDMSGYSGFTTVTVPVTPSTQTNSVSISVDSIGAVGGTNGTYAIGFDVQFADTFNNDVVLRYAFAGVAGSPQGPSFVETTLSLPLSIVGVIPGHEYALYLLNSTVLSLGVIPHTYTRSADVVGYPLADRTTDDPIYYGAPSASRTIMDNLWEMYQDRDTPVDISAATVFSHTFVVANRLSSVTVRYDDAAPVSNLTVSLVSDTGVTSTISSLAIIRSSYPGYDQDHVDLSGIVSNTTTIHVSFTPKAGQMIGVQRIDIGFPVKGYDPQSRKWSDAVTRTFLGRLTPLADSRYQFIPVAWGDSISVPVNGLSELELAETYTVPNPFGHSEVRVDPSEDVMDIRVSSRWIYVTAASQKPVWLNIRSDI